MKNRGTERSEAERGRSQQLQGQRRENIEKSCKNPCKINEHMKTRGPERSEAVPYVPEALHT